VLFLLHGEIRMSPAQDAHPGYFLRDAPVSKRCVFVVFSVVSRLSWHVAFVKCRLMLSSKVRMPTASWSHHIAGTRSFRPHLRRQIRMSCRWPESHEIPTSTGYGRVMLATLTYHEPPLKLRACCLTFSLTMALSQSQRNELNFTVALKSSFHTPWYGTQSKMPCDKIVGSDFGRP